MADATTSSLALVGTATPAPTTQDPTKSGYQTTEFWVTLLVLVGIFAVVLTGKMTTENAIAFGAACLATAGYSHSRGLAKQG